MTRRRGPLRAILAVGGASACATVVLLLRASPARDPIVERRIDDPSSYWAREGFAEMVSPVRLPSRDGRESIRVFLRVPDDAPMTVVSVAGRPRLRYPPGTAAERVDGTGSWVSDVRGTRFGAGGQEYFHVLEPVDGTSAPGLAGYEWPRGDSSVEASATERFTALLRASPRLRSEGEIERLRKLNDCGGCHRHDKAEQEHATPGSPNRASDDGGLYAIQTVLADEAPLERHRARDMNADNPFVHVTCGTDDAHLVRSGSRVYFDCDDGQVPVARVDVVSALAAGDPHAEAVCGSRRYLFAHLARSGRAAFSSAFAECQISEPR
jgi:hypothetical protein